VNATRISRRFPFEVFIPPTLLFRFVTAALCSLFGQSRAACNLDQKALILHLGPSILLSTPLVSSDAPQGQRFPCASV